MKVTTEQIRLATPGEVVEEVSAVVHRPTRPGAPALLLVHGAGGDLDDPGVIALADAVAATGHLVVRANLPYREAGAKRRPPRADRSVPGLVALVGAARELAPRSAWVVGGKSYGGRVATMAVADGLDAAGVVLYSYPLHPPGKPDRLRVDHWPSVPVPCLFLQGTRDRFGSPELLDANLRKLPRRATVELVTGGDHSLRVTGKASEDGVPKAPAVVLGELGAAVAAWMEQLED